MLLESDPEMAKDIFGSDVKILQTLTQARTTNNIHNSVSAEETTHQRSLSLGSKPNFWEQKTGSGSTDELSSKNREELVTLCDQIKAFSTEEEKIQKVQSSNVKGEANDLLISFDDHHPENHDPVKKSLESELTRTESNEEINKRTSEENNEIKVENTANGDDEEISSASDDLLFKVPDVPTSKCNGDVVHKTGNAEVETVDKSDKKSTSDVNASSEDLDKQSEASETSEKEISSPIFQKGSNTQSDEASKARNAKLQKTPQRSSFLATVFTSPFSPRFSKPAINKTLSMASSQMENVGASFRAKATDLASRFGEYTRTLSNPNTPRGISGKPSTGSLIDLDSTDQGSEDLLPGAGSWNDKFLDSTSLDDLGILMPLSLAGR